MPLKLQYASDLHLEFPANRDFLKQQPLKPVGEILVLAGDIVPFAILNKHQDFFSLLSDQFEAVYWLPGNHEYYHFDIADKSGVLNEKIRSNIFLVNNTSAVYDNIQLLFSTLWSRISPANRWQIERSLNDFHVIKDEGSMFSAEKYNQLHEECLAFLQHEISSATTKKTAVFTHHCPTFLNYPAQYKGDVLNEAFAVELYDWIESSGIACWVYGHHHSNTPDFKIGKTNLVTNQLGYVQQKENLLFNTEKCVAL